VRRLTPWILGVILGVSVGISLPTAVILGLDDSQSYTATVQRAWTGSGPIYSDFQLAGPYPLPRASLGKGFVYPPSAIPVLAPYGLGRGVALVLDIGGVIALFATFLALLPRTLNGRLLAALLTFNPIMADTIRVGTLTPWLAASVGLMWLRPATSGYLSAIGGAVKIYPLAGLVWAIRKRAPIVLPLLVAAGIGAISLLWSWPDFFTAWANGQPACYTLPSFACAGVPWLGYVVAGLFVVGCAVARRDDVAFASLSLGMVAASPDLWPAYLYIPAIGCIPLLRRLFATMPRLAAGGWLGS
jgi:hypothetical protein